MQLRVVIGLLYFKDNLRTIEAQFPKKLRTTEAHFEFTGPYKKTSRQEASNGHRFPCPAQLFLLLFSL